MKAIRIEWDVDDPKDLESLPTEVEIPLEIADGEEISDYLTELTGFCHKGFAIEDGDLELSGAQVERNDEIYNAVYTLCQIMAEDEDLEWDMAFIGEIADYAADLLTQRGIRVRFPSIVTDTDGTQYIEEFFNEEECP